MVTDVTVTRGTTPAIYLNNYLSLTRQLSVSDLTLYYTQCQEFDILYNTLFSREDNFAKSESEIFSREDIFANLLFTRKFLPAKISSRENIFSRIYPLAKISVVIMWFMTSPKSVRLKDRDYDVTPHIIAHMYPQIRNGSVKECSCSQVMLAASLLSRPC